jgi:hypothetical protein
VAGRSQEWRPQQRHAYCVRTAHTALRHCRRQVS